MGVPVQNTYVYSLSFADDQVLLDNTTEIKYRISQTRKAISALNSILWHKNITKNRKLYIYETIIQNILV